MSACFHSGLTMTSCESGRGHIQAARRMWSTSILLRNVCHSYMESSLAPVPDRILEILDDRVFNFAQAAQRHFKTNDLVIVLDLREESPELQALPRQGLAEAQELALDIRLKVSRPAAKLEEVLGSPEQSFWFILIFEDEDAECGAVNAAMLATPRSGSPLGN